MNFRMKIKRIQCLDKEFKKNMGLETRVENRASKVKVGFQSHIKIPNQDKVS